MAAGRWAQPAACLSAEYGKFERNSSDLGWYNPSEAQQAGPGNTNT